MTKQEIFHNAIENNNILIVKALLQEKNAKPFMNVWAIEHAAGNGYVEIVKLLLNDKRINTSHHAISCASENGYIEIVKALLKDNRIDPTTSNNYSIKHANKNNHHSTVKLLWRDSRVKTTLLSTIPELYNKLSKEEVINKLKVF